MNELIKITTNEEGQNCVSARELHEGLKATERFQQWFDKRVKKYGFEENVDYIGCKFFHTLAKQELQDYVITLDMAKELCMVQNNELGRKFRKYFIECEKQFKEMQKPQLTKEQELQLRVLNGDSMSRTIALGEYKEFIEAPLKEEITTLQAFTDVITCTDTCISMKEFADLSFNLYHMGRNKLMETLRIMSILTRNNIPYQRFIKCGYFEVEEVNRNSKIVTVTRITPKGQKYLCKKLNKHLQVKNNIMKNVTIRYEDPKVLQEKYTTITNKYTI